MARKVAVVECGGSKFITGLVEEDSSEIIAKRKVDMEFGSGSEFVESVMQNLKYSIEESGCSLDDIDCIGAVSAGTWDYKEGVVRPPNLPFDDKKIPLGRRIREEFGKRVFVENDVNAAVMAEQVFGYGRDNDVRYIGYLTISTGIGFGLLDTSNSELFVGESGKAPEVGHNVIVPEGFE